MKMAHHKVSSRHRAITAAPSRAGIPAVNSQANSRRRLTYRHPVAHYARRFRTPLHVAKALFSGTIGDCRQLCALPKRAAVGSAAAHQFHESTLIAPNDARFTR